MSTCCGSNGTPFVQTRFLGASVVRFSTQVDWNGSGGGMQVELAEDLCNGDAFNPPSIGAPVYFSMGGFTHGGILQNWKQNNSATGEKAYTVNITSPSDIMSGCQLILSSYDGPTMGVPNLINVYGWLEANFGYVCAEVGFHNDEDEPRFLANLTYPPAPGFGGAFENEVGISWRLIRQALMNTVNSAAGSIYGGPLSFRGHTYLVDISDLPLLDGNTRLSGENMSLDDIIAEVCDLGGVDYFYDLTTIGTGCAPWGGDVPTTNIIKVRTSVGSWQRFDESAELVDAACGSQIDNRLSRGIIGKAIQNSQCLTRYGRGLELRLENTNSFLTGEFRNDVWQTEYEGDGDGDDTIWPYWGKNPNGTVILGEGLDDGKFSVNRNDADAYHRFTANTEHLQLGIDEWEVTTPELRAALKSNDAWQWWLLVHEPTKFDKLIEHDDGNEGEGHERVDFENAAANHVNEVAQRINNAAGEVGEDGANADNMVGQNPGFGIDTLNANMKKLCDTISKETEHRFEMMHAFVKKFAEEYLGKQFMVKTPALCWKRNSDRPYSIDTNWEPADSGWTEWPVLGLPNNHWILEQFRDDEGKIKCFMKFQAPFGRRLLLDNLSKDDYFAYDEYNVFVEGTADEIVWVTPNDPRVVVKISGPVQAKNPYGVLSAALISLAVLLPTVEDQAFNPNDPENQKKIQNVINAILEQDGGEEFFMSMEEPVLMPTAAVVPLQSTRLVYGPWFAKKVDIPGFDFFGGGNLFHGSDNGKTVYNRESGFAPWNFGSFAMMNRVAYSTAYSMLGDKYVVEMGDITFPGAPVGSLGSLLDAGGPIISNIDVQVGRGSGAVTTTYRMKTHTPDTGKMAKHRLAQIRRGIQTAIKANRMFKKYTQNRLKDAYERRLAQHIIKKEATRGKRGGSPAFIMSASAGTDVNSTLNTTQEEDVRYIKGVSTPATINKPTNYEESNQAEEPHAVTSMAISPLHDEQYGMRADFPHYWRKRAYMETAGMFRPFSTLPHNQKHDEDDAYYMAHWRNDINRDRLMSGGQAEQKLHEKSGYETGKGGFLTNNVDYFSHDQVPPIFCKEHQLPINITTTSPFLSKGRSLLRRTSDGWSSGGVSMSDNPDTSVGHDIRYIARDGVYPVDLSVRNPSDNYSTNNWYRGIALKGPLVLAAWGFDIDNKPVPNKSTTYPYNPQMKFEEDWLRKPQKWMCGPVDLRWDYKRQMWTAPTPMKPVKLELEEHLMTEQCANAILYDDQEQYDYQGNSITLEGECSRQGYRVKVYSNAMYPIPKGWKIMAYFDTTHNRYQLINHDKLPTVLVELDKETENLCEDRTGVIIRPAGGCHLDPCDALTDMEIELINDLNQPICEGKVYAEICGFEGSKEGKEGPTLHGCEVRCPQPIKAKGIILQGEFKPHCIVTYLELLEFYCWGWNVSCDQDNVTIYSQGAVNVCWDASLDIDVNAAVPAFSVQTNEDTHSHTVDISGSAGGSFEGTTDTYSHTHEVTGKTQNDTHSHTCTFVSGEADIDIETELSDFIVNITGNTDTDGATNITLDLDAEISGGGVNCSAVGTITGTASFDETGTFNGTTDENDPCALDLTETVTPITGGAVVTVNVDDLSCISTNSAEVTCTGSGCECSCTVEVTNECTLSGLATVTISDIIDEIDVEVTGNICSHTHTFDGSVRISGTANVSGTANIDCSAIASGLTVSGTATGQIPNHSHAIDLNDNVTGVTATVSGSAPVTGEVTCSEETHSHAVDITTDNDAHSHTITGTVSGLELDGGTANDYTHSHTIEIPCQPVNVYEAADFELDIDARFLPGSCTLSVGVLNKNFWEYYWYDLCICTRAIWHEAELGPSTCALNSTPACDEDCDNIDCEDTPTCTVGGTRHPTGNVSWFNFANDETLLQIADDCGNRSEGECSASAPTASAGVVPLKPCDESPDLPVIIVSGVSENTPYLSDGNDEDFCSGDSNYDTNADNILWTNRPDLGPDL